MTEIDWEYVAGVADKVAYSLSQQWSIVEKDDVKQAILLHAYERRPLIERNYSEPFIWTFCKKAGQQYASAERDARDVEDGRYYYTPGEARMALTTFVYSDDEIGALMGQEDDLTNCRITDNVISARLDASLALNRLPKHQKQILTRRYVMGLPAHDKTDAKAAQRAVDALARQMNRDMRKAAQ
ncbi:hypothetical protein [Streptomyces sp. NPDC055036]